MKVRDNHRPNLRNTLSEKRTHSDPSELCFPKNGRNTAYSESYIPKNGRTLTTRRDGQTRPYTPKRTPFITLNNAPTCRAGSIPSLHASSRIISL